MALSINYLCLTFAYSLFVFLCPSSISCLGNQWEDCRSVHACGHFRLAYPFGIRGSGCGDPQFQLHCTDQGSAVLLNINGDDYQILEPYLLANNSNHSMTILNNYTTMLEQGFEITWHVDPNRYRSCSACLISNGSCGYNISQPLAFLCYCPDGSAYPNTCADPHVLLPGNISSSTTDVKSASLLNYKYISLGAPAPSPHNDAATALFSPTATSPLTSPTAAPPLNDGIILSPSASLSPAPTAAPPSNDGIILSPAASVSPAPGEGTDVPSPAPGESVNDEGGKNIFTIVIVIFSGGAALTAIAIGLFTFYLKRGKHYLPQRGRSTSKVEKFLKEYAYKMPTRYSQSRLKKITNNYAEKLGEGGYGVVYKGKLPNGSLVAVKLLDRQRHSEAQFMNEVATIGLVHHVNLVRLLGYCFETPTSALVYEYMVNGSLEKFIFAEKEKGQILGWEQLHSIALGTARGIAYLHQDCEKRIIHFDIKPHNILLDSDFTPKVADFGLAKLCVKEVDHLSMTAARGTPGYVAPEVCDNNVGPVTDKSDVYSFGMLLLEIVGGRKNFDWKVSRSSQYYFPEWVFKVLDGGELALRLRGEEIVQAEDEEKAKRLTKVGLWCIQYNYRDRPCMNRVVQMLEGIGDDVSNPPLPINSSTTIEDICENPLLSST